MCIDRKTRVSRGSTDSTQPKAAALLAEGQPGPELVVPIDAGRRPDRDSRPPRLAIAAALLGIGGLLGWLVASQNGDVQAAGNTGVEPAATTNVISSLSQQPESDGSLTVRWSDAALVPNIPPGWQVADHSGVAEAGGRLFLVVQLRRSDSGEMANGLWSTRDGLSWTSEPLDLGTPIAAPRLTATEEDLLLTASSGGNDALWLGTQATGVGTYSWSRVPLRIPDGLSSQVLTTTVASDGAALTVVAGEMEIWRDIVTPFVPAGVDLEDGRWMYEGGEFLHRIDGDQDIRLFSEPPEVVISDRRIWIRIATVDGEEVFSTVPLPGGTYPAAATPLLTDIKLVAAWTSPDGSDFTPVEGLDFLPVGILHPISWGDGFVAAVDDSGVALAPNEATVLWTSRSGRVWQRDSNQPPAECSPFSIVGGGDSIHLTSVTGIQCQREFDSDWVILDEPCAVCYKIGGPAGFLGYPNRFRYDRGLLSGDGRSWNEIEIPAIEPYPTLAVLDERLVAISILGGASDEDSQVRIWVGAMGLSTG